METEYVFFLVNALTFIRKRFRTNKSNIVMILTDQSVMRR